MRWFRLVAAVTVAAGLGLCARSQLGVGGGSQPASARALGIHASQVPETMHQQALQALAGDARRREHRFLEAADPGHLFRTTRLEQGEVARVDLETLYEVGGQLFDHQFKSADGYGGKDLPRFGRVHTGARGGPDAHRCADCHRRGGPAGAGDTADNAYLDGDGDRPASALERNPPPLHGAGLVEILAREMTEDLQAQRAALVRAARSASAPQTVRLLTKGVDFGELGADAEGRLDTRKVAGVELDLVVRPFGWKGHTATLREMVEDELNLHHGMQSSWLVGHAAPSIVGPFGGPDPDGDGVVDEITEGQVTALTVFLAMQGVPQVDMPDEAVQLVMWSEGRRSFEALGCSGCHVPSLPLRSTEYVLPSRDGGPPVRIDLARQGGSPRLSPPAEGGGYRVYLYSDLKRHVIGPNLREPRSHRGVSAAQFMTPRLWGIARSRPYLHDGRAPTMEDAILAHSGAATPAMKAFDALTEHERAPLRVFLTSLSRMRVLVAP